MLIRHGLERSWLRRGALAALVMGLALLTTGVLVAQEAQPLHQFFGSADCCGSGLLVDGELAADGTEIAAINEAGAVVATAVITEGTWLIQVDTGNAATVSFTAGGAFLTGPFAVEPGGLTELALDLATFPPGFAVSAEGFFEVVADPDDGVPNRSATALPDGRVLLADEEATLFDPATGTLTTLDAPEELHSFHTATLLPGGSVLFTGGAEVDAEGNLTTFADAVHFDLETESFTVLEGMTIPRVGHSATLLEDGRVVVIGGLDIFGTEREPDRDFLGSIEIYDPGPEGSALGTAAFTEAGSLNTARFSHAAVRREDGTIVVIAGQNPEGFQENAVEIFDPVTGINRSGGATGFFDLAVSAFELPDGEILIADGDRVERYDPATGFRRLIAGAEDLPRPGFRAESVLLDDGRLLLIGGLENDTSVRLTRTTLVDIETGAVEVGPALSQPRSGVPLTAVTLPDGTVLVAGGVTGPIGPISSAVTTVEVLRGLQAAPPVFPTPPTQILSLGPGFNLSGWLGGTAVAEATASIAGQFESIFLWEAERRVFASFRAEGPAFLNDLEELNFADAFWIFVSDPNGAEWEQPSFTGEREVALPAGLSLVLWTGPDRTPVAEAFAGIADALVSASTWDPEAQGFLTFRPGAPAFVNTADVLRYGHGVWVDMSAPTTWSQPASAP